MTPDDWALSVPPELLRRSEDRVPREWAVKGAKRRTPAGVGQKPKERKTSAIVRNVRRIPSRTDYAGRPLSDIERAVESTFGLEPGIPRPGLFPLAVHPRTGDVSLTLPEPLYDMARSFVAPGVVLSGGNVDLGDEASNFAWNTSGMGSASSFAAKPLEEGIAFGMAGAPRRVAAQARSLAVNQAPTTTRDLSKIAFDPETYDLRKGEMHRLADLAVKTQHNRIVPQGATLGMKDIAGNAVIGTMSDRSAAGTTITGLGNVDFDIPVHEYGGQDFMAVNPGYGWAVSTPGVAAGIMNKAKAFYDKYGKFPLLAPYRMAGTGTDFSKTTGELLMSHANSAFGKDDRDRANALIGQYIRDFKGIENPEGYAQYGALPTEQRKALQEALHRDAAFTESGGLSLPLTRALITDPAQIDKPSYMLQNIGVIDPTRDVLVDFARNPTYGYNLPVEFLGTMDPDINVAEVAHGMLNKKYADLGDLSEFRGQSATLSVSEWRRQQKEYRAAMDKYEAALAAGKSPKAPRKPVRAGNTQKFLQPGVSGFIDDETARAIQDRLSALGF